MKLDTDRILACLFGGALGDAIGAQWEGSQPATSFDVPDALSITDDTQFTLATCASISRAGRPAPDLIAEEFVDWFRGRRFTRMGASTLKAMVELDAGGHWASVGCTGERAAGNGAAMRIAPLAFCVDPTDITSRTLIKDICNITHRHDEAYLGALALVLTIRHSAQTGELSVDVFDWLCGQLPDSRVRDRIAALATSQPTVSQYAKKYGSSGFVVDSVPMAILAAVKASNFLDMMQVIAGCGGDTDTIGSMFGQIWGARIGTSGLPLDLIDRIDDAPLIRKTFEEFTTAGRETV